MVMHPKDAEYPHVPTPKELELSRQLVELQQEKDQREQKLIDQIKHLESQVHKLQVRNHDLSQSLQAIKREHTHLQQLAVDEERCIWRAKVDALQLELNQEKHDKEAQHKWQCKFLASSQQQQQQLPGSSSVRTDHSSTRQDVTVSNVAMAVNDVDPANDVFAKFAQNIALLPASSAVKVTQAGVLPFLAHLLCEDLGDLVSGSVLLALVHLAIHEKPQRPLLHRRVLTSVSSEADTQLTIGINVKDEIVKAGVAAPLVRILEYGKNPRVVVEAARLCAALAGYVPNKRVLAAKNAVRHLTTLLTPSVPRESTEDEEQPYDTPPTDKLPLVGDEETQAAALSALVNLAHDSEILRSQIVNFGFLPIAVRYVREGAGLRVQCEAAKLLGNLAFNHIVNQSAAMTCEGDAALSKCLNAANLHASPELVRASAIGIANLAHTSVNQLSIGYGEATTNLLQLAVDSTSPSVLEAVLSAITCLCHQNPLNKSRVIAQNGLQVLLYVISQSKRYGNDESTLVAACECFAVVARTKAGRSQVLELDGHFPICQLCKRATSAELLEASASAVCALVPSPSERAAMLADSRESKLETNRIGISALERARHLLSQQTQAPVIPSWLAAGIEALKAYAAGGVVSNSDVADGGDVAASAGEFHERSYFSLESFTNIAPDQFCPHFYE